MGFSVCGCYGNGKRTVFIEHRETYDFKILKGIDPEIVKVSGGKAYLFFKRAFDIVFAIVVGLVLFFIYANNLIVIAIKLDSRGLVLY